MYYSASLRILSFILSKFMYNNLCNQIKIITLPIHYYSCLQSPVLTKFSYYRLISYEKLIVDFDAKYT